MLPKRKQTYVYMHVIYVLIYLYTMCCICCIISLICLVSLPLSLSMYIYNIYGPIFLGWSKPMSCIGISNHLYEITSQHKLQPGRPKLSNLDHVGLISSQRGSAKPSPAKLSPWPPAEGPGGGGAPAP